MTFAIKAEVRDPRAKTLAFIAQKTMYGGKHIAEGDTIFVFASENEGGQGLIARGIVTSAHAIARRRGIARQTPRVSITVRRTALARRPLGRTELRHFTNWTDGQPATELNFKFYRQATNKIVGLSEAAALFLQKFFQPVSRDAFRPATSTRSLEASKHDVIRVAASRIRPGNGRHASRPRAGA